MDRKAHWEQVYASKPAERLGWYLPHLRTSLAWIDELGLSRDAPIIDVGGGVSTLVDDLLSAGYGNITVLDISAQALSSKQSWLGEKSKQVNWLAGDISMIELPARYFELWHDRAVFHFLTTVEQQRRYRDNLLKSLKPGGHAIIATFAPEAPPRCSGLPVQRYTPRELENTLDGDLELKRHHKELHITPGGVEQMYLYCCFARKT